MKNFLLGCNFWDSKSGTDMWVNFDEISLENDLAALEKSGVTALRVFPNWRDFQPVTALRAWRGGFKEYRLTGDRLPENEYFIETAMIERFRKFCEMADRHSIKLVVSILTGWMSGRLFCPPCLDSKNLISDPEALMFEEKFVRGFVKYTRDIKNIVMWDLGNECNCLGASQSRAQSYLWTATIRNAILTSDASRPISSGMHGLDFAESGIWPICDQGILCDYLTPHPYPSPTIGGDVDPADRMRTTMLPTAQCAYYEGLSHRPTILQEQGTFSDMLINREGAADFMRVNICSALANNVEGYFWWCAHEHLHLTKPPYTWSMIERELGLLDEKREPKPVGDTMKSMQKIIENLPEIPKKEDNAVIILSNEQNQWAVGASAFILAKRAGLSPVMRAFTDINNIPHMPIYILPSIVGWAPVYREILDILLDRVAHEGATLYISTASGFITEFEKVTGLTSHGMSNGIVTYMTLDGKKYSAVQTKRFELEAKTAEVIAYDDQNVPIFTSNAFGKGNVYFLAFPVESLLWGRSGAYAKGMPEYSEIYRKFAANVTENQIIRSENPETSLTLHKTDDGYIAVIVNYTNTPEDAKILLKEGCKMTPIYGDATCVGACDMAVLKVNEV